MLHPLRERDFALLWAGMAASLLGDGVYFVAVAWEAYHLSNHPSALAAVGVAYTGGTVAFLLLGGVISDRLPRRRVMMGADVARAAILGAMAALTVAGALHLWMLVALATVYGIADAFYLPAFNALLPDLVAEELLLAANAMGSAARNLALRVIGPALGGLVVGLAGAGTGFLFDAGTFVVSFACLAAMRVRETPGGGTKMLREMKAGWTYVRSQTWLWATLVAAAVALLVFFGPTEVLIPYLIKNRMEGGAEGFGLFLAAYGLGWIAGSTWTGGRALSRRPVRFIYLWWGIGSFPMCLYAVASHTWQLALLGFCIGVPMAVGLVVWNVLMQSRVPRALLGRVSSVDWFVSTSLTPVSFALTAPVVSLIGIDGTFVAAGALGGASTLALLFLVPGLRERGHVGGEAGVGDGGGLHPGDLDAGAAGEPGDGADHGQPVIAARGDHPAL
jgi:MFS family permease